MTEVMEKVAVIAGLEIEWKCPFSHDEDADDYENDFIGTGAKLGKKLETGRPTSNNPDYGGEDELVRDLDPRRRPGHPFERSENAAPITLVDRAGRARGWPVACAAHHLIPAQASLARSFLLKWLIKKGETASVKKRGSVKRVSGHVANHVGYDVNGSQNGIWLPGPYAMKGIWKEFADVDDKEEEVPESDDMAGSPADERPQESTQFDYAVVTMNSARAQFHDSHPDYSDFVLEALNLIASRLTVFKQERACDRCDEKIGRMNVPAPYSLIERLNCVSSRLKSRLENGPEFWKKNLYTSGKALEYMNRPGYTSPGAPAPKPTG